MRASVTFVCFSFHSLLDQAETAHITEIRTYAVIPLQETCGLIEWVPDTAGIRNILIKCYEPRGLVTWVGSQFHKLPGL